MVTIDPALAHAIIPAIVPILAPHLKLIDSLNPLAVIK